VVHGVDQLRVTASRAMIQTTLYVIALSDLQKVKEGGSGQTAFDRSITDTDN